MKQNSVAFFKFFSISSFLSVIFSSILLLTVTNNAISQSGSALSFDGVDDFVECPNNSSFNGLSLTVEAWVKPFLRADGTTITQYPNNILSNDVPANYGRGFGANILNTSAGITVEYYNGFKYIPANIVSGQWYHIAVVYSLGNIKTYLNGSLIDNTTYTEGPKNNSMKFTIGKHNDDIGLASRRFFKGDIDEVRVWNRVLAQSEIQKSMNCELNTTQNALSAYYNFNHGLAGGVNSGVNTLFDFSGKNVNGTLFNFMLSGISSNWVTPGAVQNGINCALTLYTFIGNGNWSDSLNWMGNKIPPVILPTGSEIVINPTFNGECILDRVQHISADAKLTVQQNKKFILAGDLHNYSKPIANFDFTTSNLEQLPVTLSCIYTGTGINVSYSWFFGNGTTSNQQNPSINYSSGGIYTIKLVTTNPIGSDSITKQIRISPYPQVYNSINGTTLNLYAWEGTKVMILSRNSNLNRASMFKWVKTMDTTFNYYKTCTGREPNPYAPTYITNRSTIADVPATCGAGCGFIGATGFELQNEFFDFNYNVIENNNQFDHLCFYEFGRNFWFYGSKVDYKEAGSFPIAGAFAVWMGSMEGRDAVGVSGSTVNGETYVQAKVRFASFVDRYVADPTLNWANTLAVDKGIPGYCNAADLFTSMCMRLKRDYGGDNFLKNIWKNVALRPNAVSTQDAVDNIFLAACATANKNLTTLFQSWRIPLSASAVTAASLYP